MCLILSTFAAMVFQKSNPATSGVCVCNIWTDVKLPWLLPFYSCRKPVYICRGRQGRCMAVANEAPCSWLGYGVWSTPRTCFFRHSKGPSSEPQPPWFYSSTVATICSLCIRTFLRILAETISPTVFLNFWYIFAEIMSPMNFGSFWETIAETLFWIFNMLVKTLWTLVMTTFDNIGCPTSFSRSTSCGSFINLTI